MRQIVVLELVDRLQVELDVGLALPIEKPKLHCISLTAQTFTCYVGDFGSRGKKWLPGLDSN